jgi:cytochrome c oxidase subunit 2
MAFVLAAVIVALTVGSIIFHFASPWYFTELASHWSTIDVTVDITFWITGIVFVLVNLFTAYCVVKFRHKPGRKAHYEPESHKLEMWLTGITSVGVALMLAPGLIVWGEFVAVPEDAIQVEALGRQWHWSYRFPGDDGQFGNTDVRQMTSDNPMGVDPADPAGMDDIIVSQPILHVPVDQPIHALLRSTDVLHNFTVPQFRVKMDLVPGMVTYQWFTPTLPGTYEVLCEELCGVGHFAMRSKVVVDTQEDYDAWLAAQPRFADTLARPVGNAARGQGTYAICAACHGQQGEGNVALNAPKIAGQEGWYIRRQIENYNNGMRGGAEDIYGAQMAPMARTLATPQAVADVIAYIETLPDTPAEATIFGDVERGANTYQTCAVCHRRDGQGTWGTNAPRLTGMSDWYLKRQLENYKAQIRGGHDDDIYGDQMFMMASSLKNEQSVDNVIAYINSLD